MRKPRLALALFALSLAACKAREAAPPPPAPTAPAEAGMASAPPSSDCSSFAVVVIGASRPGDVPVAPGDRPGSSRPQRGHVSSEDPGGTGSPQPSQNSRSATAPPGAFGIRSLLGSAHPSPRLARTWRAARRLGPTWAP